MLQTMSLPPSSAPIASGWNDSLPGGIRTAGGLVPLHGTLSQRVSGNCFEITHRINGSVTAMRTGIRGAHRRSQASEERRRVNSTPTPIPSQCPRHELIRPSTLGQGKVHRLAAGHEIANLVNGPQPFDVQFQDHPPMIPKPLVQAHLSWDPLLPFRLMSHGTRLARESSRSDCYHPR